MCDPATKTVCKETLLYDPDTFPDGFELPEKEGRSCLISKRLVGSVGRKGEEAKGTREGAETGEWESDSGGGAATRNFKPGLRPLSFCRL